MNIIILGDKHQKRMKSKGCVGLMKHNNKNILNHQYKIIRTVFPNSKIIYIYGFDSKRFSSYIAKNITNYHNTVFVNNHQYDTHNNVYSLDLIKNHLNEHCLIFFGDHIIQTSLFKQFHLTSESQVFINNKIKTRLGCVINNNRIDNISYDLENYLSEIYFISKNQIEHFKHLISNPKNHNHFIFEILNKMIDSNQNIKPLQVGAKQYV